MERIVLVHARKVLLQRECDINANCDYNLQFEECIKSTELIEFKITVVIL